ncbi:MAG: DUF1549 and DUF1553 domain-containing protein, partial [Planctomycetia bacterium]
MMRNWITAGAAALGLAVATWTPAAAPVAPTEIVKEIAKPPATIRPAKVRFAPEGTVEKADFQRHVLPAMGRLGCNGRACHGSFQGQGGFRLSLFGYDFKTDHEALAAGEKPRIDAKTPSNSLMVRKALDKEPHEGGQRFEEGSWEHRLFLRWIEEGARSPQSPVAFDRLEVRPTEFVFTKPGETVQLQVIAHWADGVTEDVTCLSRFRTNDEAVAEIDVDGKVVSLGKGDTHVVAFYDNGIACTQVILPVGDKVGPNYPETPVRTKVDGLIVDKLRKLGVTPSETCTDAEFLRRVSLDLAGTPPPPKEIETFLADRSADKRAKKIDEILGRRDYAAWWSTRLCDVMGNNPSSLDNNGYSQQMSTDWHRWIEKRIAENRPYDEIVADVVMANSRKEGQDFASYSAEMSKMYAKSAGGKKGNKDELYKDAKPADADKPDFAACEEMPYFWARSNMRKPEEKALNFSYTFLGVRLECAQCHKHPFDQWTQDDFNQFTAFFSTINYGYRPEARDEMKKMEEAIGITKNVKGGDARRLREKALAGGKTVPFMEVFTTTPRVNPKAAVAKGKEKAKNAKPTARVITPKLLGGEEVVLQKFGDPRQPLMDWMRDPGNPYFAKAVVNRVWAAYFNQGIIHPADDLNLANPPSNEALLDHLVDGFRDNDFDLKWLHREILNSDAYQRSWKTNDTTEFDEKNSSRAVIRRLPAEVVVDAVQLATAGKLELTEKLSDPNIRAIGPTTVGGRRGVSNFALTVFGKPARLTLCDCERQSEPNLLQSIYLRNDNETFGSIDRGGGWLSEVKTALNRGKGPSPEAAAAVRANQEQLKS